ncbi:hypothetical protein IMZ38_05175 [Thermosphaera chiliense]|uniref:Uncharacterized protein n=1 Tax=Thermosphaera chiliense TaxID=3402707 RepID=A0A7M1UP43_9CREN|nr:hypothetical protein [Thermosphaera aggregans]QOR94035.1 hypothetical protein IMZ38_05175 [Thermosphaera aggregans]
MEIDLTKSASCSDNPVSRILSLLNEGVEDFTVIVRADVVPFDFAKLVAGKKGYEVEKLEEKEVIVKLRFRKKQGV